MGYTQTKISLSVKEECNALYTCTIHSGNKTLIHKVLDSSIVGSCWYGAVELKTIDNSGNLLDSMIYAGICKYRILGNGDIMSIIEKAEEVIDEKEAMSTAKKIQSGKMDLEDFLSQLKQIKKLGPLENLIKLLPGARKMGLNNISIDPKQFARLEAIISSMTIKERKHPEIIKASRKQRIANGSGTSVQEVNKLLTQFEQMQKMMKMMKNGNFKMPF